jgi:transposase
MPRRIQITPHLSLEELERRYRHAGDGIERSHYQIIWLLAQGRTPAEVADSVGYSRNWIYELVRGYNRYGPEYLGDKRQDNPGQPPLLNDIQKAQLWQTLQQPPEDGSRWDGPKVAQWMSEVLGRPIHPQRGWEYLKNLQLRYHSHSALSQHSAATSRREKQPSHWDETVGEAAQPSTVHWWGQSSESRQDAG